jgi:hypothetical protein
MNEKLGFGANTRLLSFYLKLCWKIVESNGLKLGARPGSPLSTLDGSCNPLSAHFLISRKGIIISASSQRGW